MGLNLGPLLIHSNDFLTKEVVIEGYRTLLLFFHQLTFGLKSIKLKSIEHDYIRTLSLSLTSYAKFSQSGRHQGRTQQVGPWFNYCLLPPCKPFLPTLVTYANYVKTRMYESRIWSENFAECLRKRQPRKRQPNQMRM